MLRALMTRAIEHLQHGLLSAEQVRASHKVARLDSQLVRDRTYFVIEERGVAAGCGGWSLRRSEQKFSPFFPSLRPAFQQTASLTRPRKPISTYQMTGVRLEPVVHRPSNTSEH